MVWKAFIHEKQKPNHLLGSWGKNLFKMLGLFLKAVQSIISFLLFIQYKIPYLKKIEYLLLAANPLQEIIELLLKCMVDDSQSGN